jgi:hypothetical protein
VQGSLLVDKSPKAPKPEIRGQLEVQVGRLMDRKLGLCLEEVRAQARLEGMDLTVERIEAKTEGGEVEAQGRISHLLQPTWTLHLKASGLQAAPLLARLLQKPREGLPRGTLDLEGDLEGSGENLFFQGELRAPQLRAWGQQLADLRAHLNVRGSHIHVQGLKAKFPWSIISLRGRLDLAPSPAVLEAEWRLEEIDLREATKALHPITVGGMGVLEGRLNGPVGALQLHGGLHLSRIKGQWLPVEELSGQFFYGEGRLHYRLESPDGRVLFCGQGNGWSRKSPHLAILQVRNVFVEKLFREQGASGKRGLLSGHWVFSGSMARAKVGGEMKLDGISTMGGRFETWGEFSERGEGGWCLESEVLSRDYQVRGVPLSMRLRFSLDQRRLQLRELSLNDQARMFGVMEMTNQRRLNGQLVFSQMDTRWFGEFLWPSLVQNQVEGLISGRLELSGTLSRPQALGEVQWSHGRLAGLDGLSWHLPLELSAGTLNLGPSLLRRRGHRLMSLGGKVNGEGIISLQAWGEQVEAGALAQLFQQTSEEVGGRLDFQCRLWGPVRSPIFEGQLRWSPGHLRMVSFDDFQVCLRGEGGQLKIERFSMMEQDRSRMSATGSVPYGFLGQPGKAGQEGELDLSIGIQGDVLSLLPSVTSVVEEASGVGEVSFRLGGTPGSLVLGSGLLRFREGWIRPAIFVEELKNFNGWIEIDENDHFLEIKEFTGTVDDGQIELANFRELEHRGLEPLQVPGLGLNLGILGLRTGEDGIAVNVPGLMVGGEMGRIRLSGTDLQEPLILAGPLEAPRVLGMLGLNHLDFTYPPSSSAEGAQLDFLAGVHWDLTVLALKDVWYEKDFANLRVKDTQSRLHFTGSGEEGTLRVEGRAEADRGEVTYLDRQFQVVKLDLEFEGHKKSSLRGYDNRPLVSGQFETTVYSESTGVATDIFITLYAIDPETGERTLRGTWGDFKLELSSSDPSDDTEEKILAKLGYTEDYADKALQLIQVTLGPKLESRFIRPVLMPVERSIERVLGIDVVRFQAGLARNLLIQDESPPGVERSLSRRLLFPRSSLLIGKYLTDNCFLSYLGQFRTRTDEFLDDRLGICHRFGLEFRLRGSTNLDFEYDYVRDLTEGDKKVRISIDKRIQLTHRFPF